MLSIAGRAATSGCIRVSVTGALIVSNVDLLFIKYHYSYFANTFFFRFICMESFFLFCRKDRLVLAKSGREKRRGNIEYVISLTLTPKCSTHSNIETKVFIYLK